MVPVVMSMPQHVHVAPLLHWLSGGFRVQFKVWLSLLKPFRTLCEGIWETIYSHGFCLTDKIRQSWQAWCHPSGSRKCVLCHKTYFLDTPPPIFQMSFKTWSWVKNIVELLLVVFCIIWSMLCPDIFFCFLSFKV